MEISRSSGTLRIVIALLLGFAAIGYGAYSYSAQSSALDSAVTVNATVTSVSVEESASRGNKYRPKATFTYTYEGESYTSSNLFPGELPREFGSEEKASAQLEGYQPGDTVTAYVPPTSPGKAYLKRSSSNKPFLVIGFGVLMILGAVRSVRKQ